MTWWQLLALAGETLERAGVPEPEADAWALFSECFGMNRAMYFLRRDETVPGEAVYGGLILGESNLGRSSLDEVRVAAGQAVPAEDGSGDEGAPERFVRWVRLRSQRIPLQQITGHQEFMGLDFAVNEHVLIPRQDTEILVETVLDDLKRGCVCPKALPYEISSEQTCAKPESEGCGPAFAGVSNGGLDKLRILDMCAGSGCIGISLERLAPVSVSVLGVDISEDALKVARANGERLGCADYRAIKSDLFAKIDGRFQVIVSNPPYIPTEVIGTLEAEVKEHEPLLALDGQADGLTFYRRIIGAAPGYLAENGRIYFEIGYDQGQTVSGLLRGAGFVEVRVIRDLAGLDRVVAAVWRD